MRGVMSVVTPSYAFLGSAHLASVGRRAARRNALCYLAGRPQIHFIVSKMNVTSVHKLESTISQVRFVCYSC